MATTTHHPTCRRQDHQPRTRTPADGRDDRAYQQAAGIFRALGDPARLHLLTLLLDGERCVTDLAQLLDDNLPAVSQRLKLLRSERVVRHRRSGKHVFYALADQHIAELIINGLDHAREADSPR